MTRAAIRAEVDEALDRELDVAAEIAFDAVVLLDRIADLANVGLVEVVALLVGRDVGATEHHIRRVTAETVDVGECDLDPLVAREVDASNTSHDLSLPLLVLGLDADNANDALALDHLAQRTDRFDGCSYLHDVSLKSRQYPGAVIRDRDGVLEVCGQRAIFRHGCPI